MSRQLIINFKYLPLLAQHKAFHIFTKLKFVCVINFRCDRKFAKTDN